VTRTYRRLTAGWIALIAIWGVGALWRPAATTALVREIWNAAHGPWFALVAFALAESIARIGRRNGVCALAGGVLAFALGVLQELIQLLGPRDADLLDGLRNGVGALLGGWTWYAWRRTLPARIDARRGAQALVTVAALIALLWPAIAAWSDQRARARTFPVLWEPGTAWTERYRLVWWGGLAVETAPPGGAFRAGQVYRWEPWWNAGPRVGLSEAQPDWRGYASLVMELENLGTDAATLAFRVNDRAHDDRPEDRFEVRVTIDPGYRRLTFPLERFRTAPANREMDLAEMTEVFFYKPLETPEPPTFLLGSWWLE